MPQACEESEEDPDTFSRGCLVRVCDRRQTAGEKEGGEREKEKEGGHGEEKQGGTEVRHGKAKEAQRERNSREGGVTKVTETE